MENIKAAYDIYDEIIGKIKKNRISTTEVADVLGKTGEVWLVQPINRGFHKVGRIHLTFAHKNSNWVMHRDIEDLQPDTILLVDLIDCDDRAPLGDIVAKYALLYCGASAIVVNGKVRDAARLIKENWPIWSIGASPIGCVNTESDGHADVELDLEMANGIAVCDDSGMIVIPKSKISEDFLIGLDQIEALEDAWYECIDRRKLSTFQTICLRAYES